MNQKKYNIIRMLFRLNVFLLITIPLFSCSNKKSFNSAEQFADALMKIQSSTDPEIVQFFIDETAEQLHYVFDRKEGRPDFSGAVEVGEIVLRSLKKENESYILLEEFDEDFPVLRSKVRFNELVIKIIQHAKKFDLVHKKGYYANLEYSKYPSMLEIDQLIPSLKESSKNLADVEFDFCENYNLDTKIFIQSKRQSIKQNKNVGKVKFSGGKTFNLDMLEKGLIQDTLANQFFIKGCDYAYKNQFKNAQEEFLKGLEIEPNNKILLNSVGNTLMELEDYSKALKFYDKSLQVDSSFSQTYLNLAVMYSRMGLSEYSINTYKKGMEYENRLHSLGTFHYNLAIEYYETKKYFKAENHVLKAIDLLDRGGLRRMANGLLLKISAAQLQ